jgi:hypothetical protein
MEDTPDLGDNTEFEWCRPVEKVKERSPDIHREITKGPYYNGPSGDREKKIRRSSNKDGRGSKEQLKQTKRDADGQA